jgi:hypothetical protein
MNKARALSGRTRKTAGRAGPKPYAIPAKLLRSIDALATSQHGGSGSTETVSTSGSAANHVGSDSSNDGLTLNTKPTGNQGSDGISTTWHPAKRPGGGSAQAPRRGTSVSRGKAGTSRGAITPLRLPSSTPSASASAGEASAALLAAVAGAGSAGTQIASPGVAGAPPVPKISAIHAGAGESNQGGGGVTFIADADPGPTSSGGGTPLPGSTPDPVTGNSSSMTEDISEPFNMYVLDNNAGVVLYPGVQQLATLNGWTETRTRLVLTAVFRSVRARTCIAFLAVGGRLGNLRRSITPGDPSITMARAHLVDPAVTRWYHCVTRCVRLSFLLSEGPVDRRQLFDQRLQEPAGILAVSVGGFSVMDNHLHVLVRLDLDLAKGWSDEEVVQRWGRLFPPRDKSREPLPVTQAWVQ